MYPNVNNKNMRSVHIIKIENQTENKKQKTYIHRAFIITISYVL